jgi:hypothetical protein
MSKTNRTKIASKSFSSKHYLEISCFAESVDMGTYARIDEAIFFEISQEYDRNRRISMQLKSIDLRSMSYALKEIIKTGSTQWIKYTDPSTAKAQGSKKSISLKADGKTIYLNVSSANMLISFGMDYYYTASFADCIALLAQELECEIYKIQRGLSGIQ